MVLTQGNRWYDARMRYSYGFFQELSTSALLGWPAGVADDVPSATRGTRR